MTLAAQIADIGKNIDKARQNAPLAGQNTGILAASKGQSAAIIENAIQNGLTVFGENRVQEACEKWPELKKNHPDIELHLIGSLQTNKVREALALFDVIQTLDRKKLADAIANELAKPNHPIIQSSNQRFFIQINTGSEPQKAGVLPNEADDFIRYCTADLKLPVVGLMCVPPADQPPAPHFALLRDIALRHGLNQLSTGMSGDYETAVRMGSTCVRIGTALFGSR